MTDITSAKNKIQSEEVGYRAAVSEAMLNKIGGNINWMIDAGAVQDGLISTNITNIANNASGVAQNVIDIAANSADIAVLEQGLSATVIDTTPISKVSNQSYRKTTDFGSGTTVADTDLFTIEYVCGGGIVRFSVMADFVNSEYKLGLRLGTSGTHYRFDVLNEGIGDGRLNDDVLDDLGLNGDFGKMKYIDYDSRGRRGETIRIILENVSGGALNKVTFSVSETIS